MIKIVGITLTYNEEKMIPYVMPYYEKMGIDKLVVYDNGSTDRTIEELSKYNFVEIRHFDSDGFNDQIHIDIKNNVWKEFKDKYDWCICSDFDEVIYTDEDIRDVLSRKKIMGKTIFLPCIFNLFSEKFPDCKNALIHDAIGSGSYWKDYKTNIAWGKKSLLFSLKDIDEMNYTWGCHNDSPIGNVNFFSDELMAFHLKYIDFDYCLEKCILKRERNSDFNKSYGLSINDQPIEINKLRALYDENETYKLTIGAYKRACNAMTYHFKYVEFGIDKYFHKDINDCNKYIVCACAKNEDLYIEEWVKHYLDYGFDKIIICDNNDENTIENILKEYIKDGRVEIFNCRHLDSFQVQFYSYFCECGYYKWCAYFDIDEFLELNNYGNVKDYLNTKDSIDCVSFNWVMYGSNGEKHYKEGLVQERFKLPLCPINMFKENCFIKSIVRGGENRFTECHFNGSHIPTCSNQSTLVYNVGGYRNVDYVSHEHFPPRYKEGYIKHYYTKSFDEWIKKSSRGWPDGTVSLTTSNFFLLEGGVDFPMDKYIDGLFIYTDTNDIIDKNPKVFEEFDIFLIKNTNKFIYSLFACMFRIMSRVQNKTFILMDEHIDDTSFNIFFEYGIKTNNKVVFCRNEEELNSSFNKNNKNNKNRCYYVFDF